MINIRIFTNEYKLQHNGISERVIIQKEANDIEEAKDIIISFSRIKQFAFADIKYLEQLILYYDKKFIYLTKTKEYNKQLSIYDLF